MVTESSPETEMKSGPRILIDNDAAPATSRTRPINPSVRVLLDRRATMDGYCKPRAQSSQLTCRFWITEQRPRPRCISGLLTYSRNRSSVRFIPNKELADGPAIAASHDFNHSVSPQFRL